MQKLLLVEDDPALQFTIQTALEEKGYAVDAVSSTGEAIERLSGGAYPIVISDIYIDERTGLDVLDAAKRKDPLCSVILMTGRGTVETVIQATRGGAFDYIAKPFDLDVMLGAIEQAQAEGLAAVDFLRRPEAYKYRWGARDRATLRIHVRRDAVLSKIHDQRAA